MRLINIYHPGEKLKYPHSVSSLIIILVLVGCTLTSKPVVAPPQDTLTTTPSMMNEVNRTTQPETATPKPTRTTIPTTTITPTITPTFVGWPTMPATYDLSNIPVNQEGNSCDDPVQSPDEQWTVEVCAGSYDLSSIYTHIYKNDHTLEWFLPYFQVYGAYLIVCEDNSLVETCSTMSHYGKIYPYSWVNNNTLYLRAYIEADGPGLEFINGFALYRLNLLSGLLETILPKTASFAISPDGQYLIFSIKENADEVKLLNLHNSQMIKLPLLMDSEKIADIGNFQWNSTGTKVSFDIVPPEWYEDETFLSEDLRRSFTYDLMTKTVTENLK